MVLLSERREREPVIGVIGGMGPYAGLDLVRKVFDETAANTDQEHLPVALLSYSQRIQDRTAYALGRTEENPGIAIADVGAALDRLGATVAGIPCNSAHMPPIFDVTVDLLRRRGCQMRLLHLIHETMQHIQETLPDVRRVGVLSTLGTFRLGVYEKAIRASGLEPVMPTERIQDRFVNRAIYDPVFGIKAQSDPVTPQATELLLHAMRFLSVHDAEAIILGCTELPLAVPASWNFTVVDPARALARALIRATYPHKLRPIESACT